MNTKKTQDYQLIRSKRKTIAIEVKKDCTVVVRAPEKCNARIIDAFVEKNAKWIENALLKAEKRKSLADSYAVAPEDKAEYKKRAEEYLPGRVKYWSEITGLVPSYVHITSAEKRYGSCNGKNGICFSYRLMAYPPETVDYVILHELAHIIHKNHSQNFYMYIKEFMPDYKRHEKILKHKGD